MPGFVRHVTYSPCNCELGPVHFEIYRCPLVGLCRHKCKQHSVVYLQRHRLRLLCSHPVNNTVNFWAGSWITLISSHDRRCIYVHYAYYYNDILELHRRTERQTGRQTERQTGGQQTDRQAGR